MPAAIVETFENGSDNGNWHLSSDPCRLLATSGGNPGARLHGQVSAVPTWYLPLGSTGTRASTEVPDRAVTLDIETTFGTGDFSQGVDAYFIGKDISIFPLGWNTY